MAGNPSRERYEEAGVVSGLWLKLIFATTLRNAPCDAEAGRGWRFAQVLRNNELHKVAGCNDNVNNRCIEREGKVLRQQQGVEVVGENQEELKRVVRCRCGKSQAWTVKARKTERWETATGNNGPNKSGTGQSIARVSLAGGPHDAGWTSPPPRCGAKGGLSDLPHRGPMHLLQALPSCKHSKSDETGSSRLE